MKVIVTKPNIILINCDDVGYGDIGCYGSTCNHTPRLDRMAEEGMRFTDFYMAAPVCSPSRAAMLTGCYPARIGFDQPDEHGNWVLFPGDSRGLHPDEITIGKMLQQAGYRTALIGKWHCGDQMAFLPFNHGFDEYVGLPYSNDMGPEHKNIEFPPLPLVGNSKIIELDPDQAHLTARYTELSIDFIQKNRDQSFFLYLAHFYTHMPLHPDPRFVDDSENGDYGAEIACLDWSTGQILDALDQFGLAENTLVIFTSDNGSNHKLNHGSSNAPLAAGKGSTYEGGMRVPMIARWPGRIPAGQVCSQLCTAMDFLPTFSDLASVNRPHDRKIDGHNITELLSGQREANVQSQPFYYYYEDRLEAVRLGRWKYHFARDYLFDLKNDIEEKFDLSDQYPEIVNNLQELAVGIRHEIGDALCSIKGYQRRPIGWINEPKMLSDMSLDQALFVCEYD